jgi:hypothetical protein
MTIDNVGNVLAKTYTSLTPGTSYAYRVRAVSAEGRRSAWSNVAVATALEPYNAATGGTVTDVPNYNGTTETWRFHRFNASGTLTVSRAVQPFYAVAVGGGGGGGGGREGGGGGGGAGKYLETQSLVLQAAAIAITIGAGGVGSPTTGGAADTGGTTTVGSLSATGGTGGISGWSPNGGGRGGTSGNGFAGGGTSGDIARAGGGGGATAIGPTECWGGGYGGAGKTHATLGVCAEGGGGGGNNGYGLTGRGPGGGGGGGPYLQQVTGLTGAAGVVLIGYRIG